LNRRAKQLSRRRLVERSNVVPILEQTTKGFLYDASVQVFLMQSDQRP
jgi:hypothetical protein